MLVSDAPFVIYRLSFANPLSNHSTLYSGLVLALNARLLFKRPDAFDRLLTALPNSGILAWTGTGEPPIPNQQVDSLRNRFVEKAMANRINFDCITS